MRRLTDLHFFVAVIALLGSTESVVIVQPVDPKLTFAGWVESRPLRYSFFAGLCDAVNAASFVSPDSEAVTVFAPTSDVEASVLAEATKGMDSLQEAGYVKRHMVQGRYSSVALRGMLTEEDSIALDTRAGTQLTITSTRGGRILLNGSIIISEETSLRDGVILGINGVLREDELSSGASKVGLQATVPFFLAFISYAAPTVLGKISLGLSR